MPSRWTLCGVAAVGNRIGRRGLSTVRQEGGSQLWQLALGLQPAEALSGPEHGRGSPAQRHRGVAPALDVAADAPHRAHDVLDDAGAGEREVQLPRQAEVDHGQDLVEPLQDRRYAAGDLCETPC